MSCQDCIYSAVHYWHKGRNELRCNQPAAVAYRRRVSPTWSCGRFTPDAQLHIEPELRFPVVNGFGGSHAR